MSHTSDSPESKATVEGARQAYRAPKLRDYGHVREITRSNFGSTYSGDDGGTSAPYVYAS